jgi:hypothetical protein
VKVLLEKVLETVSGHVVGSQFLSHNIHVVNEVLKACQVSAVCAYIADYHHESTAAERGSCSRLPGYRGVPFSNADRRIAERTFFRREAAAGSSLRSE